MWPWWQCRMLYPVVPQGESFAALHISCGNHKRHVHYKVWKQRVESVAPIPPWNEKLSRCVAL